MYLELRLHVLAFHVQQQRCELSLTFLTCDLAQHTVNVRK